MVEMRKKCAGEGLLERGTGASVAGKAGIATETQLAGGLGAAGSQQPSGLVLSRAVGQVVLACLRAHTAAYRGLLLA